MPLLTAERWAIDRSTLDAAVASIGGMVVTDEQITAFIERVSRAYSDAGFEAYVISEGVAHIPVIGALTKTPDYYFTMFGGGNAVYGDIAQALRAADDNPEIERITLEIDSPGGEVEGLQGLLDVLASVEKPVRAEVTDKALSAAYAIAAQADEIIVNNSGAALGSIGIAIRQYVGDDVVVLTSTNAPNKRPDASTEDGREEIVRELDELHEAFASSIAEGRSRATGDDISTSDVNKRYGRGRTVYAERALDLGMIDGIEPPPSAKSGSRSGASASASDTDDEGGAMTLDEFKAKHPDIFAAAVSQGHEAGVAAERSRVEAHLDVGREFNAMEDAQKFIADGSDFGDAKVQARYMIAARNAGERTASADDDPENVEPDGGDTKPGVQAKGTDPEGVGDGLNVEEIFKRARSKVGLAPEGEGATA